MKKLKVGIIGCGRIFKKHYFAILKNNNLVITSICDVNFQNLNKLSFVKNLDKIKKYTNLILFLKKEKLDICVICTPSGLHLKHANIASNYVKNIIIEKPMSISLKRSYDLIKNINKKKCNVFIVKQNRLNKPIVFLKNLINKKKLGKIKLITTRVRWSRDLNYFNQANWRGKWKSDGGVLANQASHHLDLLLWLIESKIEFVSALSTRIVDKIQAHDTVIGNIKFNNGIIANVEATTGALPSNLEGSISVFGQKGTVIIGGNSVNILVHAFVNNKKLKNKNTFSEFPKDVYGHGHSRFYDEILKTIKNKKKNTFNLESSIRSIELIHAMYKSAKLKKNINFQKNKKIYFNEMED
jgi:UDP-N-acetyl-2-amino-2-deoxyglucuronate dehydrogenase